MSPTIRILLGIFMILHGLVHPIMTMVPGINQDPPVFGDFWKRSWLLGEGPAVKTAILVLAILTFLIFLAAGLSLMGIFLPVAWAKSLILIAAGLSLVTLVVFWNNWLIIGILLDVILIVGALVANWPKFDI